MKVYEATVIDRVASREGEEDVKYESHVAVLKPEEVRKDPDDLEGLLAPYTDEDIHYYFTEDEWRDNLQDDGTIETDEFTYWVGERIA